MAFSKSTRPLVALSSNGKTLACIPTLPAGAESTTVLRVLLFEVDSGSLQTTLTHRSKPGEDPLQIPTKLLFLGSTTLAVLFPNQLLAWDLKRGVVSYTTSAKKDTVFHDICGTHDGNHMYILTLSSESGKVQIQQYNAVTGKMERKIKAGKKGGASGVGVSDDLKLLVVRHEDSLRVLSHEDGQKVAKCGSLTETLAGDQNLAVCQNHLGATISQGQVVLVHLKTGKKLSSIPLDSTVTSSTHSAFELWQQNSDSAILCEGEKLHKISLDSGEVEKTWSAPLDGSVERQVHLGHKNTVLALMSKNGEYQIAKASLEESASSDEIKLSWRSPESESEKDASKKKASAKRKEASKDTVLGPTHAGSEVLVSERPSAKRLKSDYTDGEPTKEWEKDTEGKDERDEGDGDKSDEEQEQDADKSPTIGERLEQLREYLEEEDLRDEMDEDDPEYDAQYNFHPAKVTTESLSKMLDQALQSGDERMLELALSVRDEKIMKDTCRGLETKLLDQLLTALTTRLATRSSRAEHMCMWIMILLKTGRVRSLSRLQPLRNLVEERVAVFPDLLRLQGRLDLMSG